MGKEIEPGVWSHFFHGSNHFIKSTGHLHTQCALQTVGMGMMLGCSKMANKEPVAPAWLTSRMEKLAQKSADEIEGTGTRLILHNLIASSLIDKEIYNYTV